MDLVTLLFIATGLAMDATAVSISSGLVIQSHRVFNGLKMAVMFGLFQALMPLLGWIAGVSFFAAISHFDHWIAFGLLGIIGGHMIYNGISSSQENTLNPASLSMLLLLAIATSIDALAAGLSFAFLNVRIIRAVTVIGIVTLVFSATGFSIANAVGRKFGSKVEIVGGLILVGIGIKILLQHLFFQPVPWQ